MDTVKEQAIRGIVDGAIARFADGLVERYRRDVDNPVGVVNRKFNNCFVSGLDADFVFHSAFVRSFDSSFGKMLESLGNEIAGLSYDVRSDVKSFLLPQQSQHIDFMISEYENHAVPSVEDYSSFTCVMPSDRSSYVRSHVTDHYFFKESTGEHFLIELKAGGDLDNKKAKTEKIALLQEFFILKNSLPADCGESVRLFFATAYNAFGEGCFWKQDRVRQFFAEDELLIGGDYWNFVCDDPGGFEVVLDQYRESSVRIRGALREIKGLYGVEGF